MTYYVRSSLGRGFATRLWKYSGVNSVRAASENSRAPLHCTQLLAAFTHRTVLILIAFTLNLSIPFPLRVDSVAEAQSSNGGTANRCGGAH